MAILDVLHFSLLIHSPLISTFIYALDDVTLWTVLTVFPLSDFLLDITNEMHLLKIRRLEKRPQVTSWLCFISFSKARASALSGFWEPCYPFYPFSFRDSNVYILLLAWDINEKFLVFLTLLFYFKPVNTFKKFPLFSYSQLPHLNIYYLFSARTLPKSGLFTARKKELTEYSKIKTMFFIANVIQHLLTSTKILHSRSAPSVL